MTTGFFSVNSIHYLRFLSSILVLLSVLAFSICSLHSLYDYLILFVSSSASWLLFYIYFSLFYCLSINPSITMTSIQHSSSFQPWLSVCFLVYLLICYVRDPVSVPLSILPPSISQSTFLSLRIFLSVFSLSSTDNGHLPPLALAAYAAGAACALPTVAWPEGSRDA